MSDWCTFAIRRDGPGWKLGYGGSTTNAKEGVVCHSMEGSLAAAFGELDKPSRQASWTFSVAKNGDVYQHYVANAIAWASGSSQANKRFVGIENEGVAGEDLTEQQRSSLLRLLRWLFDNGGWARPERGTNLLEHRECTKFGSAATACPSGRIPWDWLLANWEETMAGITEEQVAALIKAAVDRLDARVDMLLGAFNVAEGDLKHMIKLSDLVLEKDYAGIRAYLDQNALGV